MQHGTLEEMQWSVVRQEDASEAEGEVYKTVVRQALLYGAETWARTRRQKARLEVNEMRMQRSMCGVTRRDKIRNKHIRGTDNKSGASVQENYRKTTEVVRPCEKDGRGAHSEKNVRCGHTGEKRRGRPNLRWKDTCKRDMTEVGLKRTTRQTGQH